jgi:hypothetical protein
MFYTRTNVTRLLCFTFISIGCSSASAEMIYASALRSITGAGSQVNEKLVASDGFGSFTDDLLTGGYFRDENNLIVGSVSATASQTSTLAGGQIRGLGRGSGFGSGPADGVGRSEMHIEFNIEKSMRFTLAGQLLLVPHGDSLDLNGSSAVVRLSGPDGIAMERLMDGVNLPDNLGAVDFTGENRLTGVFPVGTYILEAMSEGHGSDGLTRCVDFDFTFSAFEAVAEPEPAASVLSLSLTGLAVCSLRRRRT